MGIHTAHWSWSLDSKETSSPINPRWENQAAFCFCPKKVEVSHFFKSPSTLDELFEMACRHPKKAYSEWNRVHHFRLEILMNSSQVIQVMRFKKLEKKKGYDMLLWYAMILKCQWKTNPPTIHLSRVTSLPLSCWLCGVRKGMPSAKSQTMASFHHEKRTTRRRVMQMQHFP